MGKGNLFSKKKGKHYKKHARNKVLLTNNYNRLINKLDTARRTKWNVSINCKEINKLVEKLYTSLSNLRDANNI